jgi:peptide-methionine (S)-S-oxide reductase
MKLFFIVILIFFHMLSEAKTNEVVLGGGCFWCTEAIFKQLNGVYEVTPGYSGGNTTRPTYEDVCTGETGFIEVVKISYNPDEISFEKLLEVFFKIHDPTSIDRQGADEGYQYHSVIFYTIPQQKEIAVEYIKRLNESKILGKPVVTEVLPLHSFFNAENYHQNYFERNKNQPYCQYVIRPKLNKLQELFNGIIKK